MLYDVRKYNIIQYATFIDACHARGNASNDHEWRECLDEAKGFHYPKELGELFVFICI